MSDDKKPSARAQEMAAKAKIFAQAELDRHRANGTLRVTPDVAERETCLALAHGYLTASFGNSDPESDDGQRTKSQLARFFASARQAAADAARAEYETLHEAALKREIGLRDQLQDTRNDNQRYIVANKAAANDLTEARAEIERLRGRIETLQTNLQQAVLNGETAVQAEREGVK